MPPGAQQERMARGKALLEIMLETPVTTLIPPWNSYDLNTLQAALDSGLTTVSADMTGLSPDRSPLRFVPATCRFAHLKSAVRWARFTRDPAPVIVVLFHPYDFSEEPGQRASEVRFVQQLLKWISVQTDVRTQTVAGLCAAGVTVDSERFRAAQAARAAWINRALPGQAIRESVYASGRKRH